MNFARPLRISSLACPIAAKPPARPRCEASLTVGSKRQPVCCLKCFKSSSCLSGRVVSVSGSARLKPGGGVPCGRDLRHPANARVASRIIRTSRAVSGAFATSSVSSGSPSSGTSASTNGSNRLSRMLDSANRAVPARTDAAVSVVDSPTAVIIPAPTRTTLSGIRLRGLLSGGANFVHTQRFLVAAQRSAPHECQSILIRFDQHGVKIRRCRLRRAVNEVRDFDAYWRQLYPQDPRRRNALGLNPVARLEVTRGDEPRRGELEKPRIEVAREIGRALLLPPRVIRSRERQPRLPVPANRGEAGGSWRLLPAGNQIRRVFEVGQGRAVELRLPVLCVVAWFHRIPGLGTELLSFIIHSPV